MKPILLSVITILLVTSCRKDIDSTDSNPAYLRVIQTSLSDSLSKADFKSLDFERSSQTRLDSGNSLIRIPFKGIKMSEQFVLLKAKEDGEISQGVIVNLQKKASERGKEYVYNGVIDIAYLNRTKKLQSQIINGFIVAFHTNGSLQRSLVVPSESNVLPEVIVTCYVKSQNGGLEYLDWINLPGSMGEQSCFTYNLLGDGGSGGGSNGGGSGNTGGGMPSDGSATIGGEGSQDDQILVDFEPAENFPPIDLTKYLKCFANLPDAGSVCSISILADIPVDNDPNKLLNWQTGSPGHTFIQLKKRVGNQVIMQNIGFYPAQRWKTILTDAPIEGKFVDNGTHEFNASLAMNVTPEQLRKTIDHMLELSKHMKYDIDDYNCTNFALDIFNTIRISNELEIPKYDLPGSTTPNGTSTPQGLYNKLVSMQQAGAEYPNVYIPSGKKFADPSSGPCN